MLARNEVFRLLATSRIGNFVAAEIGRQLVRKGDLYRLSLSSSETKVGRPIDFLCPAELTLYIDRYLEVYRPNRASWIDYRG